MAARDAILNRIRQALGRPSPEPHWLHEPTGTGPLFPLPEPTADAMTDRFRTEFVAVQGEWHAAPDLAAAREWLAGWLRPQEITSLLAIDHPLVRGLLDGLGGGVHLDWSREADPRADWEKRDIGVTPCEALVAESGTVVVSSATAGRAPSVLPHHHLVVATADQLVPDLETAISRLRDRYGDPLPSAISFITGPSRTADIEKILVLGAHGPRRLSLLMLPAEPAG